ncbi:heme-binding domain-containing protein [Candidatus Uabimicrobium amorphum]|uniref:Cytochrome c n=1 Tax=Uabimicrobium amorphum TaxID=2596890 RepID=A0A5S9IH91_UABAM|nr:heme-binding domain-containing protein [Candidatus Uabimicrobium amorphum]BBM81768.1 cytochrome c [Candidatus Uabimicrobium amorphum]
MDGLLKKAKRILLILFVVFVVMIIASYFAAGEHSNPEITNTVEWDSPQTKKYFYAACADCHSHETKWPWYSHFAPISQMIIDHVESGRNRFNISVRKMGRSKEAVVEIESGNMPLPEYIDMHSEAVLTTEQKKEFIEGLKKTFSIK